jgi:tRNA wybutosine-synthesizing protein 2
MNIEMEEPEPTERRIIFVVPRQHVKTVKTALEEHDKLDRTAKIVPEDSTLNAHGSNAFTEPLEDDQRKDVHNDESCQVAMRIPTTLSCRWIDSSGGDEFIMRMNTLSKLGLRYLTKEVSFSYHTVSTASVEKNPLRKALREVLALLPPSILASLNLTPDRLVHAFPEAYSIYPPLLLLPSNAFSSPLWKALLTAHPVSAASLQPLWKYMAGAMGVRCIAINSPIPLQRGENILRSPVNITPIYGSFGPMPTPQTLSSPTLQDFDNALWVEAIQNGIKQIWAPMYTMFSRGNIREKTRILKFSNTSTEAAVVDMYAGIGYFTFSYRHSGHKPILCFDLNPWSIEGLRRGAAANGWSTKIFNMENMHEWDEEDLTDEEGRMDMYIFQMSNTNALPLLTPHLNTLPPIRHVNLGLLPRSRDSWRDAVRLINPQKGGWIHAHENVGVMEMNKRKMEIQGIFQEYVDESGKGEEMGVKRKAEVEHVELVKMYAPGVAHCVFDVWIDGGRG